MGAGSLDGIEQTKRFLVRELWRRGITSTKLTFAGDDEALLPFLVEW